VVNGHSFILICQMAELVRLALAEVVTVPNASSCYMMWHGVCLTVRHGPTQCMVYCVQTAETKTDYHQTVNTRL